MLELSALLVIAYWHCFDLKSVKEFASIGNALAMLLGSGALGHLLSIFHHSTTGIINYRPVLKHAHENGSILVILPGGEPQEIDSLKRGGAWRVLTSIWLLLEELRKMKDDTDSLADLFHGIGAAVWGAILAFGVAVIAINLKAPTQEISLSFWIVGVVLLIFHSIAYYIVRSHFIGVVEILFLRVLCSRETSEVPLTIPVRPWDLKKKTNRNRTDNKGEAV